MTLRQYPVNQLIVVCTHPTAPTQDCFFVLSSGHPRLDALCEEAVQLQRKANVTIRDDNMVVEEAAGARGGGGWASRQAVVGRRAGCSRWEGGQAAGRLRAGGLARVGVCVSVFFHRRAYVCMHFRV